MAELAPLSFTDEQLVEAVKSAPEEVRNIISVIAMQIELAERRAADDG
jgi:hypothetical protein